MCAERVPKPAESSHEGGMVFRSSTAMWEAFLPLYRKRAALHNAASLFSCHLQGALACKRII